MILYNVYVLCLFLLVNIISLIIVYYELFKLIIIKERLMYVNLFYFVYKNIFLWYELWRLLINKKVYNLKKKR